MRPRKSTTKKQHVAGPKAAVIDLANYRGSAEDNPRIPAINANFLARHNLVVDHLLSKTETIAPSAVAAALVVLRSDGTVDTSAIGLEPEFVPFLSRGLDDLATSLAKRSRSAAPRGRQDGGLALSVISALAFMAATYINEHAWLDAALSLAAQFWAAKFWDKSAR
jgi:hypothetical protein